MPSFKLGEFKGPTFDIFLVIYLGVEALTVGFFVRLHQNVARFSYPEKANPARKDNKVQEGGY